MPLEFRCASCAKLLRTPDESAGKKAKCPQCGAIVEVPLESTAETSAGEHSPPTGQIERNPFGPMEPTADPVRVENDVNPYASPTTYSAPPSQAAVKGELRHTAISFDDVLRKSWAFFKENIGQLALFGAVVFAINFALQMVGQVASLAVQASGEPVAIGAFFVLNTLVGILVQVYINLGSVIYMLKMARTQRAQIGDLFTAGPFFLKGLGLGILLGMIFGGIFTLFCFIPLAATIPMQEPPLSISVGVIGGILATVVATIIWLRYLLGFYFLVDRGTGVFESLGHSAHYMQGNMIATFLVSVVVLFLGGLFFCATCSFGNILYVPFFGILVAIIYLTATGQPYEEPVV